MLNYVTRSEYVNYVNYVFLQHPAGRNMLNYVLANYVNYVNYVIYEPT